MFILRSFVN